MATWGDQTCQRFEATAVGFETGFSRLRVRPSNRYAIAPHNTVNVTLIFQFILININVNKFGSLRSIMITRCCNVYHHMMLLCNKSNGTIFCKIHTVCFLVLITAAIIQN